MGESSQAQPNPLPPKPEQDGCTDEKLMITGQLAALGMLAGGLIHELNNPATFLVLAATQIEKVVEVIKRDQDLTRLDQILQFASGIQEATNQIRTVVGDYRLLSGAAGMSKVLTVDLERLIHAACSLTRTSRRHDATIELSIAPIPTCPGRFLLLGPALVNLVANAAQSFTDGRQPRIIRIEALPQDPNQACIRIIDGGVGISTENLPHIFDPFFTTKSPQQHPGLGLTTAKLLVTELGGSLTISSELDQGTKAEILVPLPEG